MANQKIGVTLEFKANTQQAQQALQQLQGKLQSIGSGQQIGGNINTNQIQQAAIAAQELQRHLTAATNVNTGKLDLGKLSASLQSAGSSLSQLSAQLLTCGQTGQQAFIQLATSVSQAEVSSFKLQGALGELWTSLKNVAKWQISSAILMGFVQSIQEAYQFAQDLNESLNNIRIVTGYSAEEMDKFAKKATKAAKALSTTTTAYTDAALIFYQQGLTDAEVIERTNATIKMANVTGQAVEEVSDQLTAIWNNFDNGTKSLEYYVDVITALGAATASSTDEIATGLEKFAAVAETVGLSYEYATAALATVTSETRQSAEVVGTAFKTLFARIQDLELGEKLEDGTTLGAYSQGLMAVGINIKDVNGEVKDMNIILEEMGAKWETLTAAQQVALAQTVAGVRQYTQLIALMDNWSVFQENLNTAMTSEGTLQEQADIYAESWKAAQDRVTAALEDIYQDILDDDFFIDLLDFLADLLDTVDTFLEKIGGIGPVIMGIVGMITTALSHKITPLLQQAAFSIKQMFPSGQASIITAQMQSFINQIKQIETSGVQLTAVEQQQLAGARQLLELKTQLAFNSSRMSDVEKQTAEAQLALIESSNNMLVERLAQLAQITEKSQQEQSLLREQLQLMDLIVDKEAARAAAIQERQRVEALERNLRNTKMFDEQRDKLAIRQAKVQDDITLTESQRDAAPQGSRQREAAERHLIKLRAELLEIDLEIERVEQNQAALAQDRAKYGIETTGQQQAQVYAIMEAEIDASRQRVVAASAANEEIAESGIAAYKRIATEAAQTNSSVQIGAFVKGDTKLLGELPKNVDQAKAKLQEMAQLMKVIGNTDLEEKFLAAANGAELTEQQIEELNAAIKQDTSSVADLRAKLVELGQSGEITKLDNGMKSLQASTEKSEKEIKELQEQIKKLQEENGKLSQGVNLTHQGGVVEGLSSMAGAASSAMFAFQSLKGAMKALSDENMETGEKIETVIMAIVMAVPMLISAINGLTAAGAALQISFWWVMAIVAAVVAVIALAIAAADAFTKAQKADEIAAKKANEALKAQTEIVNNLKNSYDSLKQSIEEYTATQDKIDAMTEGTLEWKEAVLESNKAVMELIAAYPMLADYVTKTNGRIQLTADGLKKLQEQELVNLQKAQAGQMAMKAYAHEADMRASRTDFVRTTGDTYTTKDQEKEVLKTVATYAIGPLGVLGAGIGLIKGQIAASQKNAQAEKDMQAALQQASAEYAQDSENFLSNYESIAKDIANGDASVFDALMENKIAIIDMMDSERLLQQENMLLRKEVIKNTQALMRNNGETTPYDDLIASMTNKFLGSQRGAVEAEAQAVMEMFDAGSQQKVANQYLQYMGLTEKYKAKYEDGQIKLYEINAETGATATESNQALDINSVVNYVAEQNLIRAATQKNGATFENNAKIYVQALKDHGITKKTNETDNEYTSRVAGYVEQALEGGMIDFNQLSYKEVSEIQALLWASNKAAITDPETADLIDTLDQSLKNYKAAYRTRNLQTTKGAIATWDVDEAKTQADIFNEAGLDHTNYDNLIEGFAKKFSFGAADIAEQAVLIDNSMATIRTAVEENVDALATRDIMNPDFIAAISEVRTALTSWLGVDLGYDYTVKNLDAVMLAMNGNQEAIEQLSFAVARQKLQDFGIPDNLALEVEQFIDQVEYAVSSGTFTTGMNGYAAGLNQYFSALEAAVMTGEVSLTNLNEIVAATGFELAYFTDAAGNFAGVDWTNTIFVGFEEGANMVQSSLEEIKGPFEDLIERYYEVNERLEDIERHMTAIDKATQRAFGANKLKLMDQYMEALTQQLDEEKNKLAEIEDNFKADRTKLLAYGANTDAAGRVSNYEELMYQWYSTLPEDEYNKRVEALEQYTETLNLMEEQRDKIRDIGYSLEDKALEKIQYTVELNVKVADNDLELLEYQLEKLDDPVDDAAEALVLLGKIAEANLNKVAIYEKSVRDVLAEDFSAKELDALLNQQDYSVLNGKELSEKQITALEDYRQALYEANAALAEFYTNIQEKVIEALEENNEGFEKNERSLKKLTSTLKTYQNVIDLVGKNSLNVSTDALRALSRAQVEAAQASLQNAQAAKNAASANLEELKAAKAARAAQATEEENKAWDEMIEKAQEQFDDAEEALASTWTDTLTTIADDFASAVEIATTAFEEAMNGIYGSYDKMQEIFDQQKELSDRYVEDYEKIYELSKLNRDITNSLDATDSIKGKQTLKDLQQDINDLQQSDTEMSKHDLQYLRKKYELKLAEIALEEAQNAKSQVRMRRDSEGNWSYVYAADQSQVSDAQQNYEDKLYEVQALEQEYIKEMQDAALQAEIDLVNAIKDLRVQDFENEAAYQAEVTRLTEYYTGKRTFMLNEMNKALQNSSTIYDEDWTNYNKYSGYKISDDKLWCQNFNETTLAILRGYTDIGDAEVQFQTNTQAMLSTLTADFSQFQLDVESAFSAIDKTLNDTSDPDSFASAVETARVNTNSETQKITQSLTSMGQTATDKFKSIVDAATTNYTTYSTKIADYITSNDLLIGSINGIIQKYKELITTKGIVDNTPDLTYTQPTVYSSSTPPPPMTSYTHPQQYFSVASFERTNREGVSVTQSQVHHLTKDELLQLYRPGGIGSMFSYVKDNMTYTIHESQVKSAMQQAGIADQYKEAIDMRSYSGSKTGSTPTIQDAQNLVDFKVGDKVTLQGTEAKPLFSYDQNRGTITRAKVMGDQYYYLQPNGYPYINTENSGGPLTVEDREEIAENCKNAPPGEHTITKVIKDPNDPQQYYYLITIPESNERYCIRAEDVKQFDTGGYTGEWDSSGRLAMLHQKEIVLNAHDTENFLAAVNIVRDIASAIDLRAAAQQSALSMVAAMTVAPAGQTLQQEVIIHAEFPNATQRTEIEAAFDTLLNRASQFANRKN